MPLPEHTLDEAVSKRREVVPDIGQLLGVRKIVLDILRPFFPFLPGLFTQVGPHQELLVAVPDDTGHP